jgi:hypothetical protein
MKNTQVARLLAYVTGMVNRQLLLAFSDPPYNIDYEGYTDEKLKIQGDNITPEQFEASLVAVFSSCREALDSRCVCSKVPSENMTGVHMSA